MRDEAWSGSDNFLAKAFARPMVKFVAQEAASGVLLLIATAIALFWANSIWSDSYHHLWETKLTLKLGDTKILAESLEHIVNDGLMVLFFFVIGLEIKSEITTGDLREPRVAALPVMAAIGGMVLPALFFVAITAGNPGANGWGVPMATDIAFALGVLALMGPRIPQKLKLFLLTLAIVDDIGGILVIAIFYTNSINYQWLSVALALLMVVIMLKRFRVWYLPVYIILGIIIWYATLESGVHATIAGVILGLLTPAKPLLAKRTFEGLEDIVSGEVIESEEVKEIGWLTRESVPMTTRLAHTLSPWTSFLVIPLFALANAGITFSSESVGKALDSPVAWGIVAGLVVGKPLGVFVATYLAVKTKLASLPENVTFLHVLGGGAVAGIGFTLSLFIAKLAFVDDEGKPLPILDAAIFGVLVASIAAAIIGWLILRACKPVDENATTHTH